MIHRSNHAAKCILHKGLTAYPVIFPIWKYLFFWISDMGNKNSWCSLTTLQQLCIPSCLTRALLVVLDACFPNVPRPPPVSQIKQLDYIVSTVKEAQLSSIYYFVHVCGKKCSTQACTHFVVSTKEAWAQTGWTSFEYFEFFFLPIR